MMSDEEYELLDENERGEKLYRIDNEVFDTVVLVENEEGHEIEYILPDMQGPWPKTLEEACEYDWRRVDAIDWEREH